MLWFIRVYKGELEPQESQVFLELRVTVVSQEYKVTQGLLVNKDLMVKQDQREEMDKMVPLEELEVLERKEAWYENW